MTTLLLYLALLIHPPVGHPVQRPGTRHPVGNPPHWVRP
jgi:hypothetical protein